MDQVPAPTPEAAGKPTHLACPLNDIPQLWDANFGVNLTTISLQRTVDMFQVSGGDTGGHDS
jgi:hypothetical protein